MKIEEVVLPFYKKLKSHNNHRYLSWEHCFAAFQNPKYDEDYDYLSLQMAFYLASWGMYRGSSVLLWKDYKTHLNVVKKIKTNRDLVSNPSKEIDSSKTDSILKLAEDIKNIYGEMYFIRPIRNGEETGKIKPTDTLVTKILLGTLGCVPAYDRFLRDGFDSNKEFKIGKTFNKSSLDSIFNFINQPDNLSSIRIVQAHISQDGNYYPLMKIVDMYFWELGRRKNAINGQVEY